MALRDFALGFLIYIISSWFKEESMKFFTMLIFLFSFSGYTEVLRIESIDLGLNSAEPNHIYLSDGRVGVVPNDHEKLDLEVLKEGAYVDIILDKNHVIQKVSPAKSPRLPERISRKVESDSYVPTVLPSMASANEIFRKMNRGWQGDSQCYNRAHVWSYEEFQRSNLKSKKVFIFFTRRYIRNYNFYWWFHSVPTVMVQHENSVVERALDPRFVKSPLSMKAWSDVFVKSKRSCPVVTRYSDYRNNQETEDCYFHFSSMFFWQPRDLETLERTGVEKKSFVRSDVNYAYWEAF